MHTWNGCCWTCTLSLFGTRTTALLRAPAVWSAVRCVSRTVRVCLSLHFVIFLSWPFLFYLIDGACSLPKPTFLNIFSSLLIRPQFVWYDCRALVILCTPPPFGLLPARVAFLPTLPFDLPGAMGVYSLCIYCVFVGCVSVFHLLDRLSRFE